ncbi:MAG TPA: hypothetical protein VJI32_04625 [Candidatus Nanoarchaeia archaeon]|nr:hypothetical protein [Candidatus Nanoarchaeia archaeon]
MKFKIIRNVYRSVGQPVCRLILGDKMDAELSKVRPKPFSGITGTIGFIDFIVRNTFVPKKNAPEKLRLWLSEDFTKVRSFTILMIGIEPEFRGKKYFPFMVNLAERMAKKLHCQCVIYHTIQNKQVLGWALERGFKPFFDHAVKYLE